MLQERPQTATIDLEEVVSTAQRAGDLLVGADALLRRRAWTDDADAPGEAMRELVTEARAALANIVESLEGALAQEHEKQRAEQAHRDAQARIHAASVGVAR